MNNLREVYNIFEEIRTTGSTNAKKNIIAAHKDNKTFLFYLEFLCNPHKVTGISKAKIHKCVNCSLSITFKTLEELISYITLHNTGTDEIIRGIQSYTRTMIQDDDLYEFALQLITKSYKLGCNRKLINSVLPNFIPTSEGKEDIQVMLATKFDQDKYKNEEIYVTEKMDGFRCNIIIRDGEVELYTRQGKLIKGCLDVEKYILELGINNVVFDGELLAKDCGYDTIYKETSMRVKNKNKIKTGIEFKIFDMLTIDEFDNKKCNRTYSERRLAINNIKENEFIKILPILYHGNDINFVRVLFNKIC